VLRSEGSTDSEASGPPHVAALPRQRLTRNLARLKGRGLLLVAAPAGYGKTTLLAQLASDAGGPVAWIWADAAESASEAFLGRLEQTLAAAIPTLPRGWDSAETACAALESWEGPSPLLVVDDFHLVKGTPAEAAVERLALRAPLRLAIGTRAVPRFNVSRIRVSGALVELQPDDLRFRSWEVEQLFREFYEEDLPPEDLASLTRRTDGWGALLKLFQLDTSGRDPLRRRRVLADLNGASTQLREYLSRNVVGELREDLRDFLVRTSVLGRLSPSVCDELLPARESDRVLDELDQRRLVLPVPEREGEFRCPETLRAHLRAALVGEVGEAGARRLDRSAATILERAGAVAEALDAVCRAKDGAALCALVERHGRQLADDPAAWVELVPPQVFRSSPWLMLGLARSQRAEGCFRAAWELYGEAEDGVGVPGARGLAAGERRAFTPWLQPGTEPGSDWLGRVRDGTISRPMAAADDPQPLEPLEQALVQGLRLVLAGDIRSAGCVLHRLRDEPGAGAALEAVASAAEAVTLLLRGDRTGVTQAELAAERADSLGLSWLARMTLAALAFRGRPGDLGECRSSRQAFERHGDEWGVALTSFMEGWGALAAGDDATVPLSRAMDLFSRLRAGVLETWARAVLALALARAGHGDAREAAVHAQVHARALGVPGAQALAYSALTIADPADSARYKSLAMALHEGLALALPTPTGETTDRSPAVSVRCFGGFSIQIRGMPIDLSSIRPRARQMLRLLALHAGRPVHREVLTEALWPDGDVDAGSRSLHVAVSSLRRVLDPPLACGTESSIIARDGEAYRLALPPGATIDLLEFDRAIARGRSANRRGEHEETCAAYGVALGLHHDELLPEDGPSEWLVRERERRAAEACEAARIIAETSLDAGDPAAAAEACERGLLVDRYQDGLWRLRIRAHEEADEPAAAALARREYAHLLQDLGLSVSGARGDSRRTR
jgi:DNA-binding SARP family transcriptional activator